ncbi:MAG: TIGR04222 domain-containing membrane protein, partial [Planctomycetaceae bacterium]|nr:TIGR04222 domain-containing membrane protein [Planctomycetaceae bacterium]
MKTLSVKELELGEKIERFVLDDPTSSFPFSHRLTGEQNWSSEFTGRVIREYKRFLFLATVVDHLVSPSKYVDEVWHLHLIYTRSYWIDLCENVLGFPLHHLPTRGGECEARKFEAAYAETLESYRSIFGEPPPRDIWPSPIRNSAISESAPPAKSGRWSWSFPRKLLLKNSLIALALLSCSGCDQLLNAGYPLNLRGPEFLSFYFYLFLSVFMVVISVRFMARSFLRVTPSSETDPYEIGYLVGGKYRTVCSALTSLVHRGNLKTDSESKRKLLISDPPPQDSHPLELAVYQEFKRSPLTTFFSLYLWGRSASAACREIDSSLVEKGFLQSRFSNFLLRSFSFGMFLLLAILGGAKIYVGLARNRPVDFLVILVVLTLLIGALFLFRCSRITRLGRRRIKQLTSDHSEWKQPGLINESISPVSAAWAVALFGPAILDYTSLRNLYEDYLLPPLNNSSGGVDT